MYIIKVRTNVFFYSDFIGLRQARNVKVDTHVITSVRTTSSYFQQIKIIFVL